MLQTGISTSYVPSWGMVEALREVLQEMFDARTKFGCQGSVKYRSGQVIVQDDGPGIKRSDLALGQSSKRDNDRLIGQFGEGLKLAALVAARNGRKFYIDTQEFSARALVTRSDELNCDVLTFDFDTTRRRRPKSGTKITIECTNEEFKAAKKFFLDLDRQRLKPIYTKTDGDTVFYPGGKIYINGVLAAEFDNLLFSYSLYGVKTLQNRDRNMVNLYDLKDKIATLLEEANNSLVPKKYLHAVKARNDYFEMEFYVRPLLKEMWRREFFNVFGPKSCRSDVPMADLEARRAGFKPLSQVSWYFDYLMEYIGIPKSGDLIKEIKPAARKETRLNKRESAVLQKAIEIVRKAWRDPGPVKVVKNLQLVAGHNVVNNAGAYDPSTKCIYLAKELLQSLPDTVGTLIHETLHKYSGARDCTREFETAWKDLVVQFLDKHGYFQLSKREVA
ncbi:hypothetical protein MTAT_19750 [Moorella thermoacetica]|uniref:Uncharacterized protein n=1 Tax=Neomoorella thermoacetica TaxID=1525 RepID=A0AAC9MVA7_NEOTH|nr:ATP-binding protein [Moorella thermoacetica]AOQ24630.1 hypothetical protein Maut_02202 [Moorella thermoacetica]TYL12733.1 hypothetical protein MTAT_19750 [Moorella thermoacetica]